MTRSARATLLAARCALAPIACGAQPPASRPLSFSEVAAAPAPPADHRVAYGADSLQFGELRLPPGPGPFPVAVVIHGGCWRAEYDLRHVDAMGAALARAGVAVWTVEYRRVGNAGGGWPGTFDDVARAADHVAPLARRFPLDTGRVVFVGHSAGGQLALWLAGRRDSASVRPRAVVALAPVADLAAFGAAGGGCGAAVAQLLGGTPAERPGRYRAASPSGRVPLGVPVHLVHGALDPIVPVAQSTDFAARARAAGDSVRVSVVDGAGHFDLVAPRAAAWQAVERAVLAAAGVR